MECCETSCREKVRPTPIYTYLAGGTVISADGGSFYSVPLPPELMSVGYGPEYKASYVSKIPFTGASYSSIEILVYEGPIETGRKLAYANAVAIGSQDATTITLQNFGCFGTPQKGPWNFDCSDMVQT